MSAVGDNISIISIGVSCQTSMQIRHNAKLISEITRSDIIADCDFLSESSMPLDWRITHPRAFIEMAKRRSFFPNTIGDFDFAHVGPYRIANWHGGYFWHDHIDDSTFDTVRNKFLHTSEKLFRPCRRRVFVLSNTQNNLYMVSNDIGVDFSFSGNLIKGVKDAIDELFPSERSELIVVTSTDRAHGDVSGWIAPTYLIDRSTAPDDDVFGDSAQWGTVFKHYFTHAHVNAV